MQPFLLLKPEKYNLTALFKFNMSRIVSLSFSKASLVSMLYQALCA